MYVDDLVRCLQSCLRTRYRRLPYPSSGIRGDGQYASWRSTVKATHVGTRPAVPAKHRKPKLRRVPFRVVESCAGPAPCPRGCNKCILIPASIGLCSLAYRRKGSAVDAPAYSASRCKLIHRRQIDFRPRVLYHGVNEHSQEVPHG